MVDPVASVPASTSSTAAKADIKVATPNLIIQSSELVPIEIMTDLIFEDIGGQEIITITRSDIINGQDVLYRPIKNLTMLSYQYSPQRVLGLQDTSKEFFDNFPIKLDAHVPAEGTGPNKEVVYLDPDTGDLVINVINMEPNELVQVSLQSKGSQYNGTIYKVDEI